MWECLCKFFCGILFFCPHLWHILASLCAFGSCALNTHTNVPRTTLLRVCVWKCVSYICFAPCLCSLLHPTRHPCLLFMGTGTAGHPSRAFSQRRKKTQYSSLDTHSLTHTHTRRMREKHTLSWLVLIRFLLCCCVPAASGSNSRTGLPVQMH